LFRKYHGGEYKQTLDKLENNRYDVIVTTHETCRDHIDKLAKIDWNAVIVDEACCVL
jgi:SNF2 family DNA or RNA helicase